jgi:membrane protein
MHFRQIRNLIGKSVAAWVDDYAPSMGAALAYYTLFSLTPLLLIAIAVAGLVFGEEAARGEIVAQIEGLIGREGAIAVQGLLESANEPAHGVVALVLSLVTLIVGATTVFAELQSDLDRIWRVPAPATKRGLLTLLRTPPAVFRPGPRAGLSAPRLAGHQCRDRRLGQMVERAFRRLGSAAACA